jgi:S-adenosylmethionine:tRNA ribosyltransferase-isomerase
LERLSDYDYELPESLIAQEPLTDRAASRLLWLHKDSGLVEHKSFRDVVNILESGDLLVLNNTRVTAFRLFGNKESGGKVELLAFRKLDDERYECLLRPGRRLQPGTVIHFTEDLTAAVEENLDEGKKLVRFRADGDILKKIEFASSVPLPPYIHSRLENPDRYQTVYAEVAGSAAAPTAGLHFTDEILAALDNKGVKTARVTLDVGLDTFRPVQVEDPADHPIHGETCEMPEATSMAIENCKGRVIAVGTTSVRTLETFAVGPRKVDVGRRDTKLFIRPGFRFQVVDGMFTNFHMPRTTMLMMISALAGRDRIMDAYSEALSARYRFLSFGDSMFIA